MSDVPNWEDVVEEEGARQALARALRQLDDEKRRKAELVEAVYKAAKDAASGVAYSEVTYKKPISKSRNRDSEVAILVLGDWQLAKVTPTYDSEVCAKRINALAEKVRTLTTIQRQDHPVTECRVYLLGDLIEGELIFPGQAYRIDASLFRQVMLDGPQILGGLLRDLLVDFEKVHVECVIGNHGSLGGRARKEYHPESNADSMLYETTKLFLADEKRLTWGPTFTDGERHWYRIDEVRGNRIFLFHGDQVKGGFAGFPWYGFGKKLLGWDRLYDFNYAISGHFHTPVRGYYNGITHWGNGSTESDNTYAQESLAAAGEPCQWLLFMTDKGIGAEYLVRL